ncbi:MAG: hypothetical protein GY778_11055 [bacterium]|nr:hypothetical protein [bacterium]
MGDNVVSRRRIAMVFVPLLFVSVEGCRVVRLPERAEASDGPTGALAFRLENATASPANVTITIEEAQGAESDTGFSINTDVESATEASIHGVDESAAKFISAEDLGANATVRVESGTFTEGEMLCGNQVVISATVGDDDGTAVQLEGSGTGTPGFDEGSVGLSGERILLFGIHYDCQAALVLRIEDDGTGVGGSTSSVGLGVVTAYEATNLPPVGDLGDFDGDPASGDGADTDGALDSGTGDSAADTVDVKLDNQTESTIALEFQVGTGDADADAQTDVTVIPFGIVNGELACAQLVTVRAQIVEADSGEVGTEPKLFQVALTGDGTGTVGFDEQSIGPGNARFLVQGEHFECGQTVVVTILDDAPNVDEEEDETARIGLGSIEVVDASP